MSTTAAAHEVRGWLSSREADELTKLTTGRRVLEIGCFVGLSTITMAKSASHVVTIDDFRGVPDSSRLDNRGETTKSESPSSMRAEFFGNIKLAGVAHKVTPIVSSWENVLSSMDLAKFDVIFHDADHSYQNTYDAGRMLFANAPDTTTICFHDFCKTDIGVVRAVKMLARETGRPLRRIGTLAIFDGAKPAEKSKRQYRILLAFPGSDFVFGAIKGVWHATTEHELRVRNHGSVWNNFNQIWAEALNDHSMGNLDIGAMLHADIVPEAGWIDILVDEMERLNADFLSVPAPIKDRRGVTSSGIGDPNNVWEPWRRFTVRELLELPETFNAEDAGYPGGILLHNTGCWIANLDNPLFKETDENGDVIASFKFPRRLYRAEDGTFKPAQESEDWYFSRALHRLGARTFITRKVKLIHSGVAEYPNNEPYGTYFHGDEDTASRWRPALEEGRQP